MLGCLPEFLPDELVYSVIAAWGDRLPLQDYPLLHLSFGGSRGYLMCHLPNNLSFFLSQLPPYYDMTLERLIIEHSLYPYYAATLLPDRRQRLWNLMYEDRGQGLHTVAGIGRTIIRSPQWLRYCPICIDEDQRKYGRAYWHRLHQIPGVFICPVHKVFIKNSNISLKVRSNYHSLQFMSPKHAQVSSAYTKVDLSRSTHLPLIQLMENTMYLLYTSDIFLDPSQIKQIYRYILYKQEFFRLKTKTNINYLASNITEFYSKSILEELGTIFDEKKKKWLFKVMNAEYKTIHPLYHLLLITFFGYSVKDFLQQPTEIKPFGSGPWTCHNIFCEYYEKPVIHEYSLEYRHHTFIGRFVCTCGYSYTLITSPNEPSFKEHKYVARAYGPVWEAAFIEIWNDETLPIKMRIKKVGMSIDTFLRYGQYLGLPLPPLGYHSAQTVVAGVPRLLTSSSSHQDLLQNDEKRKSPNQRRNRDQSSRLQVNWQERDLAICLEIGKIVTQLRSIDKKPKRITRGLIIRYLQSPYSFSVSARLDKLPETIKLITKSLDTNETFALRAVEWARLECSKTKTQMTLNAFLAFAGIRHLNLSTYVLDIARTTLQDIQKIS